MKSAFLFYIGLGIMLFSACSNKDGDYDASGSFEAIEVIVSSEVSGRIERLNIIEGQHLEKGEQVGLIDSTQLYLQKMNLLSNAEGVRAKRPNIAAQTASIKEQIITLEKERQRTTNLIKANAATQKQLDDINGQIEVLQKQLSALESELQKSSQYVTAQGSAMDSQVEQVKDKLQKSVIRSPITGNVLNKYVEEGELANMGTPLFKIADIDNMILRVYVTNDQLSDIKLNDKIKVFVDKTDQDNENKKMYEGVVTWISDKSEFTPKTIQTKNERANLVYAMKVLVKNDGYLKIGMYGEVKFN
ncbi:MAG: HlyD family efflux transporter periplasmic adaptor subunit [Dysgonamonadaceae bacterium]|jgi:HlyD family secretion protein|nr:HlyD family efflux transporter periplasmic adaptor subunit [Dysgonamonadaceae bacterium]MDD3355545.1 HlyD family efflux transporter periplasmic adaptor subunit [Dysgonamonadaceae bacterium]MDD3726938.1 HlyD family efflux transporter periplasmic adaptor subunit [Dysgonamonadaceae bacterium]MDD4245801.1 HlyD family efflux transporter periplasmic adaptor subunit [Dysgonamonadaceae bacterium]MDD4605180.1 HlyD family efflux transporter periplasmic adaptor subunit [Dysgonamonadaceae bacterium]